MLIYKCYIQRTTRHATSSSCHVSIHCTHHLVHLELLSVPLDNCIYFHLEAELVPTPKCSWFSIGRLANPRLSISLV